MSRRLTRWVRFLGSLLMNVAFTSAARGVSSDAPHPPPPPSASPATPQSSFAITVQVVPAAEIPREPYLSQNNPNPFRGPTALRFGCPTRGPLSIKVYDISGREVVTLADRTVEAGHHSVTWDCRDSGGREVAAGFYFCRMVAPSFTKTRKMLLLH